jgi:hypothetical protein
MNASPSANSAVTMIVTITGMFRRAGTDGSIGVMS